MFPRSTGVASLLILLSASVCEASPITVFDDLTTFLSNTGAMTVAIPDSATAFPGTDCGEPDTGAGLNLTMAFGTNSVTVGSGLCTFDAGNTIVPYGNTIPDLMIANTIVINGEDDYVLGFLSPVHGVGFRFLTNNRADELLTFYDQFGGLISTVDIDALTPTNTRVFVGFSSTVPIGSMTIDTVNGAVQNEGFDQLYVATGPPVPEPATLLLLGSGLGVLAARYRRRT